MGVNDRNTTTVGFRCSIETKERLEKEIIRRQYEEDWSTDIKKSDVLRALAEKWLDGEVDVSDRLDL